MEEICKKGRYEFECADICDEQKLRGIFERHRPEMVVHLAARAGVRPSVEQPLLYEKVNVQGTLVLLELSRLFGVTKFIFASSSSIYGVTSKTPFSETEANPNPISPYGVTKLAGEKACYCYTHLYKIPTICLRFFTVYGPRQRPDLAIHKFVTLIREGREIAVFGDGSSLRDYTFVDDIVDGVLAALDLDFQHEVINLGNSNPISLIRMIRLLEKHCRKPAQLRFEESQPGDMPFTHADLRKAEQLLGYQPKVAFETGIARFVDWFQQPRG